MRLFFLGLSLVILCSCGSESGEQYLQNLIGNKIIIPATLSTKIQGLDTIKNIPDTITPAKVLVYYDAKGCTPCKLRQLFEWDILMKDAASTATDYRFIYILNTCSTTVSEIETTLMGLCFEHPVLLDSVGVFEEANPGLPANPLFHTFLLDRDNRVVLVGSPIGNPRMWELYKSTIAKLVENDGTLPTEPEK